MIGLIREFNENRLKSLVFQTKYVYEPEQSKTGMKSPNSTGNVLSGVRLAHFEWHLHGIFTSYVSFRFTCETEFQNCNLSSFPYFKTGLNVKGKTLK
jgi:hypothetical protein